MISNDLRNVTDVKLKELERFQVADGTQCGDKVVYAGGTFGLAGLIAGAAHGAYPALWPKVVIRGPRIMMTFYLMGRHSVTWGLAAGAFALGACQTAKYRDREGVTSCVVGGALSGAIFGIRYRAMFPVASTTIGMFVVIATATSIFKLFHGSYVPVMPTDERIEYMRSRHKEFRTAELKEINAERVLEYEEWKTRQ